MLYPAKWINILKIDRSVLFGTPGIAFPGNGIKLFIFRWREKVVSHQSCTCPTRPICARALALNNKKDDTVWKYQTDIEIIVADKNSINRFLLYTNSYK